MLLRVELLAQFKLFARVDKIDVSVKIELLTLELSLLKLSFLFESLKLLEFLKLPLKACI